MDSKKTIDNNPLISFAKLRIIFWNARSFLQRRNEISNILKNTDIFICVESWLTAENNVRYPEFYAYRKDRVHSRGGGILILIRKNLAYNEISDLNSPDISVEMCGIRVTNINPVFELIICYRSQVRHYLNSNGIK